MTYTKHVNYVHTSSLKKCEEEINITSPTLVFICHDCYQAKDIYPTSFNEPKEFPTLSFNATLSNIKLNANNEQFNIKKSCLGSIVANSKSHKKETNEAEKTKSSTISFLSDPSKYLNSTYVLDSSKNKIFCNSYSSGYFHEFAVLHPKFNEFNLKINSSASSFVVFDVRKSKLVLPTTTDQIILTVKSILHLIFPNPKISNDLQLVLTSNQQEENYVYSACIESKSNKNFYIKKNNNLIDSKNLKLINNNDYTAELGCVINHIPGFFTKIDSCVNNIESPACINQRSLRLFQSKNPILESLIMQCRFLHLSGNIFLPSNDPMPEILSQIISNNSRFNKINNNYFMQLLKANAQIIGINKPVVTISLNDNSKGNLWSVLMFFNHISECSKSLSNMPIILKSDKHCTFLVHNLNQNQVYILPNTRRNIYAYIKDRNETIGAAFKKIQACQINKIPENKLYHFYQRNTSDVIITSKQDEEDSDTKLICLSCIKILPREFISTTDSTRSEAINTSNSIISMVYENKYSPFVLTDTQKISFR